jgi:hypothetical protein
MSFFKDPFSDSNINSQTKVNRLKSSLKNMRNNDLDTYIFIRGALDYDTELNDLFYAEEFDEDLREKFTEIDNIEKDYIETLQHIQEILTPEKPTSEAYYEVSEKLNDSEIKERFENRSYFPERERLLFYHLEFLFSNNPRYLTEIIMPRLSHLKSKNIFNLLKFKILDQSCREAKESEDPLDISDDKEYKLFCDKAILEIARFGNMQENDGVFYRVDVEESREILLETSIKLLLTMFDENISKYTDIEISKDEILFNEEIENSRGLIEYARRVKKPFADVNDARELVEKLEKYKFFLTSATENGVIPETTVKRFISEAEELVKIIEEAQKEGLKTRLCKAHSIFKDYIAGNEVDFSKDDINKIANQFKYFYDLVGRTQRDRDSKKDKIERLLSDHEEKRNFYFKYLQTILYVLKFFKFSKSSLLKDLLHGNQTQMANIEFCESFKDDEVTTVEDYLRIKLDSLTKVHKNEFSAFQKFDRGFEVAKEINSIIVKLTLTINEL